MKKAAKASVIVALLLIAAAVVYYASEVMEVRRDTPSLVGEIWEFDTRLEATSEGKTRVIVHHPITSLAESVNEEVQHFADGFDAFVERVRNALNKALENRRDK